MAQTQQIKVQPEERIDQVAARVLNDPFKHIKLLEWNPDVNLFYPHPDLLLTIRND